VIISQVPRFGYLRKVELVRVALLLLGTDLILIHFRQVVVYNSVVNSGFAGLRCLESARDTILPAVFDEIGSGLMKLKGHALVHALTAYLQHPVIVQRADIDPGLSGAGNLADAAVEILLQLDGAKHGAENNCFIFDGKLRKDGQPEIRPVLIFTGAAYNDIVIAGAPVGGNALRKALDALCEEIKHTIRAGFYHFPAFPAPFIRILQEKIGGEAGHDNGSGLYLEASVPLLFNREVEIQRFTALLRRNQAAVGSILPVYIAISAALGVLGAAMPGIPACIFPVTHNI